MKEAIAKLVNLGYLVDIDLRPRVHQPDPFKPRLRFVRGWWYIKNPFEGVPMEKWHLAYMWAYRTNTRVAVRELGKYGLTATGWNMRHFIRGTQGVVDGAASKAGYEYAQQFVKG